MRWRLKPKILVATLSVVAVAGLFSVYIYKSRPYHFLEVAEGVVYRSGTLTPHNCP